MKAERLMGFLKVLLKEALIQMLKNIIQKKILGNILNIRGLYGKSKIVAYNKGEWRSKKKFAGGGILLDQGIHLLDLINFFLRPIYKI